MNETAEAELFTFSIQTTESPFCFWFHPFPHYFPRPLATGAFSFGSPFSEDGLYPGVTFEYMGDENIGHLSCLSTTVMTALRQ